MLMKLSKRIAAVVLVLSMLLACVPVFGATLKTPIAELYVPEEGLALTSTAAGTNGAHWKFVLHANSVAALGVSHSYTSETWVNNNGPLEGSAYDGLVVSGNTKLNDTDMKTVSDGTVVEFTFTNVPLSRVSYRNNNGMSFCVQFSDLANRKYVSDVKVWDAATQSVVDYDGELIVANFKTATGYYGYTWHMDRISDC